MNTAKMLTSKEVQKAMGVSHVTVYNWRTAELLKAERKEGSRSVYFAPSQVLKLAKQRGIDLNMDKINKILAARKPAKPGPKPAAKKAARKPGRKVAAKH